MIAVDPANPRGLVWIASYPKSGSTWVRVFLHHLIRIFAGRPAADDELDRLDRTSQTEAARVDLFERFLGKALTSASLAEISEARPKVQAAIMAEASGILPVKTHNLLGSFLGFPLINRSVSAGGIYIVRDPLDVAISLAAHLAAPVDAAIATMNMSLDAATLQLGPLLRIPLSGVGAVRQSLANTGVLAPEVWGSWSEHVVSWTADSPPVILVLRYEDMLARPLESFTAVAGHMRLGAEPGEIAEAVELASFARLKAREGEAGFRERPANVSAFFREGRAGAGREQLTESQIARITDAHGAVMRRFGYVTLN